ncbi:beta strand repeat-containing protein, partial [Chryseobacterium echinoideorum]|uniref:beta strand repeat-containing protein n=1 Tax=Chryseobacterium echinoideorum TaxID=1549648 RepID=UPI003743D5A6
MKHIYFKLKKTAKIVLSAGIFLLGYLANAQTSMAAGDIAFTSYDSTPLSSVGDGFSFVLLVPISSGTSISFTDRGYNGSGWQNAGSTESTITWTSSTAIPAGTEVYILGLAASTYNPITAASTSNGTVVRTEGTSTNGLSLSNVGDQIIAFQGGSGSVTGTGVTFLAGINYFYTASTTTAGWNVGSPFPNPNASLMPPGLTGGTNAFYTGPFSGNLTASAAKFNCNGVPAANVSGIRTAVMNTSNWILDNASLGLYSGCQFLGGAPIINSQPINKTTCANATTSFSVTATGATSYQWYQNSGSGFTALSNTAPFSGVTTNTLTITGVIPAMNGYQYRCVASNSSGSATSNSASLTVTNISGTTVVTNVACNGGSTGAINLTPTGGTAPYTFNWGGGITTEDRTGLSSGTYTVTITDANGCTGTVNATVTQPATSVSGTTVVTNVACNGGSTGAINLTPTGGTAPYTFNWGGGITTEDRTGLSAGTYTVTITDANGCTGTVNATVTQPATSVSGTTVVTNVACNGGSTGAINLTPTGGTAPYTFNWGGGITTEDRTGLSAGTYTVTITDANGCTGTVNATVTQPATSVSGTTVVTNVACNGGSTGAINLTPTGGTAPYTFNWGGGITTEDRTGLAAGTYTVTITDANGCTGTVNATVTQPTALSATVSQNNVSCNGGSNGSATI